MKLLLLLALSFQALAGSDHSLQLFQVIGVETKVMDAVAEEFEVVKKISNGHEVYVPKSKIQKFLKLAPSAILVQEETYNGLITDDGYHTYKSVEVELKNLETQYPHLAKLESYGKTKSGHNLYVLKVSDNVLIDENEPELMITSATHGDEIITVEVEMEIIKLLLQNYEKDPRLTKMIKEKEIYFIPMVNPQGFSKRARYVGMVDPNRDYPHPNNTTKKSSDCIDALIKWFHSRDIKGSVDLHASGKLIMFPWAYTKDSPGEDEQTFQYVTNSMAEINKYEAGQISKIIYVAKGSSADYYYWKNKTFALGIELSTSKAPPFRSVPAVIEESKEMMWRFIEHF